MGARLKPPQQTQLQLDGARVVAWALASRGSGAVLELVDEFADEVIDVARVHELLAILLVRYHQRRPE